MDITLHFDSPVRPEMWTNVNRPRHPFYVPFLIFVSVTTDRPSERLFVLRKRGANKALSRINTDRIAPSLLLVFPCAGDKQVTLAPLRSFIRMLSSRTLTDNDTSLHRTPVYFHPRLESLSSPLKVRTGII